MAPVHPDRVTAEIEGDFVVFLIGLRINKPLKIHKWLPAVLAMPRMLKELAALPPEETGFLGHNGIGLGVTVQYWRSFDHLERYARARDHSHFPTWAAFNKRLSKNRADVGIWHETYLIREGAYEAVYSGMPPHGLGRFSRLVTASGDRQEARARLKAHKNASQNAGIEDAVER